MKRAKPKRDVRRVVRFIVCGQTVKTHKSRMTLATAIRELRGDPLANEGRLLSGVPVNVSRTVVRGVRVVLMYVCDPRPVPMIHGINLGLSDARAVIRAGVPL